MMYLSLFKYMPKSKWEKRFSYDQQIYLESGCTCFFVLFLFIIFLFLKMTILTHDTNHIGSLQGEKSENKSKQRQRE